MEEKLKLNLGCGNKHKEGFVNIDIVEPADVLYRIGTDRMIFEDNSVNYVEADNLLEHLNNDEFLFAMNEIHRVLEIGGTFWLRVPNFKRWMEGAVADPTHKRFFIKESFDYFTNKTVWEKYGRHYGFKKWELKSLEEGKFLNAVLGK